MGSVKDPVSKCKVESNGGKIRTIRIAASFLTSFLLQTWSWKGLKHTFPLLFGVGRKEPAYIIKLRLKPTLLDWSPWMQFSCLLWRKHMVGGGSTLRSHMLLARSDSRIITRVLEDGWNSQFPRPSNEIWGGFSSSFNSRHSWAIPGAT